MVTKNVNHKYKDSVFSLLFGRPDVLRGLYGALEGVTLPCDTPITINTLTDALFMERINDISFTIDEKIVVLIEHRVENCVAIFYIGVPKNLRFFGTPRVLLTRICACGCFYTLRGFMKR